MILPASMFIIFINCNKNCNCIFAVKSVPKAIEIHSNMHTSTSGVSLKPDGSKRN